MTHLRPNKLRDAMVVSGLSSQALAVASGVDLHRIDDALLGRRRLDVAAMRSLAEALGIEWFALRCDNLTGEGPCAACDAPNVLNSGDLDRARAAVERVLREARSAHADLDTWITVPGFVEAQAALVAIGSDFDVRRLQDTGLEPALAAPDADVSALAARVTEYLSRGDVATEELVGLDISGSIPNGLQVAGWTLRRFADEEIRGFSVVPSSDARTIWGWDRVAATETWWLHRDAGERPAVSTKVISFAQPRDVAPAPLLTLSLLSDDPPAALSHGWAQKGRGVAFSISSRQLGYWFEDDGYLHLEYGPYRVKDSEAEAWARYVGHLGNMAAQVFAGRTPAQQRYAAAAQQFLAVAEDLNKGLTPLPRLALEMSTVMEMLLLGGTDEGEVSRRVRVAAGWLGGIDDADRTGITSFTKKLYDAGSKYRHGGGTYVLHRGGEVRAKKHLDVARAYRLLRRLLVHGLAVAAADESVAALCDEVQRLVAPRERLEATINALYADLGVTPRRFAAV